jgi:hypothetical protein
VSIPESLADLSTIPANNSPDGGENVFPQLDNYLRAIFAFIAELNEGRAFVNLSDAPTSYTGAAYSGVRVNAGATALEFAPAGSIRIVNVTASRDLVASDFGALLICNSATAMTLTLPPFSTLAVPAESTLVVAQWGAGQVTLAGGAGVTIRSTGTLTKTRAQFSQVTLIKTDEDEALLGGDLGA